MEKLLIVDGSNLLFQMFYGMPARILNREGRAIQGTLGFVGALLKMIRMVKPTHVFVAFDGETENPRKGIDEDYKANRPDYSALPEEETPFSQLPDIYDALDVLGIRHQETENCEADDWLAGYARRYGEHMAVVIASQDSDLWQLITDSVHILRYRGEKSVLCDPAFLREKLGIGPEQYAAFKSLTGDASDNIRGVPGVGPKTAAALMNQFGDLETLLSRWEEIKKPSIRASVGENLSRIQKNHSLIRLDGAETLPFAPENLVWRDPGLTTTQALIKTGLRP